MKNIDNNVEWTLLTLFFLCLTLFTFCACNMKTGVAVNIKIPYFDTLKLEGANHKVVYGKSHGPLKVKYVNVGDTLTSQTLVDTFIVRDAASLNRYYAYIEQGYRDPSISAIKRHIRKYCNIIK